MAVLNLQRIRAQIGNSDFIRDIRYIEETDSTNAEALRSVAEGAAEGTVIMADSQRAGRGRQGRIWVSPPGRNLYLSLILRPVGWRGHLGLLAFVGGLAVVDTLESACGLSATLKWPNDVLLGGRKLAGVLVETVLDTRCGVAAVLGIGVNLNMDASDLPEALQGRATSVAIHRGFSVDRSAFAGGLLENLSRRYRAHQSGGPVSVVESWKSRTVTLGQWVVVNEPQGPVSGEAVDVTEDGFLVLREGDGRQRIVMAGDVDLR